MAPVAAIGRAACPLPAAVIAFVITGKLPFRSVVGGSILSSKIKLAQSNNSRVAKGSFGPRRGARILTFYKIFF